MSLYSQTAAMLSEAGTAIPAFQTGPGKPWGARWLGAERQMRRFPWRPAPLPAGRGAAAVRLARFLGWERWVRTETSRAPLPGGLEGRGTSARLCDPGTSSPPSRIPLTHLRQGPHTFLSLTLGAATEDTRGHPHKLPGPPFHTNTE